MSLKLVELQVALPRTQDLGKMQEHIQQKGQHLQEHLAAAQQKQDIEQRKQVNKYNEAEKNKLQKDDQNPSNGSSYTKQSRKQKKQSQQVQGHHPYKGNLIDIEG